MAGRGDRFRNTSTPSRSRSVHTSITAAGPFASHAAATAVERGTALRKSSSTHSRASKMERRIKDESRFPQSVVGARSPARPHDPVPPLLRDFGPTGNVELQIVRRDVSFDEKRNYS